MSNNDWRVTNQSKYLYGKIFLYSSWKSNDSMTDHNHCEFCFEKFGRNWLMKGYCSEDFNHWICEKCFIDFRDDFALINSCLPTK
jgi:hypothetical protein